MEHRHDFSPLIKTPYLASQVSYGVFLMNILQKIDHILRRFVDFSDTRPGHLEFLVAKNKTRADSRFAPSQWETALQSNAVSHWLGTNLESALKTIIQVQTLVQVSNHPFPDSTIHGKIFNEMPWIQLLGVSISSLTWTPEWHVPLEHQVIKYSSVCWAFNNFESVNSLKPS